MTVIKKKPRSSTTRKKPKKPLSHHRRHHLHLLTTITNTTHAFLHRHTTHLLPSQTLSLSYLLSSLSLPLPISPSSFSLLLNDLSPSLSSSLPPSIPPSSALSAALIHLSSAAVTTFPHSFFIVIKAILEKFGTSLNLGEGNRARVIVGFGWRSLPNCCGVMGFGKFRKTNGGFFLVQALVDCDGKFLDLSAGWDGGLKGSVILGESGFFRDVEGERKLLSGPSYELADGFGLNQYVLGEACFPLLPWLLTPYGRTISIRVCDEEDEVEDMESFGLKEREFNRVHCRAMGLVRRSFSRVRRRWKLLSRPWKEDCKEYFPIVVFAACLLHNFMLDHSEPEPDVCEGEDGAEEWEDMVDEEEELPAYQGAADKCGEMARDALAEHLVRVSLRK